MGGFDAVQAKMEKFFVPMMNKLGNNKVLR